MKIYVNNVGNLEDKLKLKKNIKRVRLRKIFSERRLKEFLDKIPNEYDPKTLKEFEEETGIILKYYVFEHSYDFREHTKLGVYPSPDICLSDGPIDYKEFIKSYLENYDVLVVINDKKLYKED